MAYTDIDKSDDYFNTVLYSGTGATQSITGVGFQPDLSWLKMRSAVEWQFFVDSVRGANKAVWSNATNAEYDYSGDAAQILTTFNTDGFSLGTSAAVNGSPNTFVSWNWLASNTTASNTQGTIASTVSANTTSGFSVVSWTGNSGTVGHGLGVKPACIIVKSRQSVNNWVVVHQGLGTMSGNVLVLNSTGAASGGGAGQVEPTANVFTITSGLAANDNNIGYVFAEKKGFSKFGSYAGNNNADGTFVYTGFSPSFLLVKRYGGGTQNWVIYDNKRNTYNLTNSVLRPNTSDAETTNNGVDLLSNGFKFRSNDGDSNGYSDGYIYIAFAENPLVTSTGIPTTAR